MPTFLDRYSDHVYGVTRVAVGFLFACHAAQKLFGVLGGIRDLHDPEGLLAGSIEFFGGLLVALGLAGAIAAFVASGEMAVAYFRAHAPIGSGPSETVESGQYSIASFSSMLLPRVPDASL